MPFQFSNRLALVLLCGLASMQIAWINPLREKVEQANEMYFQGDYEKAIQNYTDIAATYAPESEELHFNIGNAWFRQEHYDKAMEEFQQVYGSTDEMLEAKAYYNVGNCHFRKEDYVKAIEAYVESLKLNPDDEDAKYNLELARRKLKEQLDKNKQQQDQQQQQQQDQQQQDQQQQQQQNQQNQEDQQQEGQQQQQQEEKQEQQQQDQQQQQEQQEQQQAQQQAEPPKEEMTKEQALQLLQSLEEDEKQKREDYRRHQAKARVNVEKDW